MLSCGRWIVSSPVSTELSGTGSPLMVTVAVTPASAPTAHARSSASVVPLRSKVLHSVVHPAMKILVPAFTVHVTEPPPPPTNGATNLPPSTTHWGPPPPNGLSGVGVSRTFVHKCPRVFPRLVGAALADGATKQNVTAARSSARARRAMRSPSARNRADRLVSLVPSALVSTLSLAPPPVKSPQLVNPEFRSSRGRRRLHPCVAHARSGRLPFVSSRSPLVPASPGESTSGAASRCRLIHDRPGARSCHGSSVARAAPRRHRPNWPEPNSVTTFRQNQPQTAGSSSTLGDADRLPSNLQIGIFRCMGAIASHARGGTDCSRRSARSN